MDFANSMLSEDIFEGWLSIPAVDNFLEFQPQLSPKDTTNVVSDPPVKEDAEMSLTRHAGVGRGYQSIPQSPSESTTTDTTIRKRRCHTKSRLGCINCKKRKVKCQETWPSCANCMRRGIPCRYPAVFKHTQHDRVASELLSQPRQYIQLSDSPGPSTYNANDMRLFHHFIISAHPCIPFEYESVWVKDIPTFSHEYEYLMHGILALAASHLDLFVEDPKPRLALLHRQKAIEGLEKAFTRWPPKACEAHVMLATSYLLAFQSSYMPDGMLDHVLSIRGCAMLSQMILTHKFEGAFSIEPSLHGLWFEWKMKNFPSLDQHLAREALKSLADFAPCIATSKDHEIERALIAQLVECVRPLLVSLDSEQTPQPSSTSSFAGSPSELAIMTELSPSEGRGIFTLASTCEPVGLFKNPLLPSKLALDFNDIHSWGTITEVLPGHQPEPARAFNALMSSLLVLSTGPRKAVINLFSSSNIIGNIVMAHFCCVRFIIAPLSAPESAMKTPMKAMVEWYEQILDAVEDDGEVEWTKYVEWPKKVLLTMRSCLNQKINLTFGDLYDILMNDPGAFREGRMRVLVESGRDT